MTSNTPNKILEVDEFLALRKEIKHMLKHDVTTEAADNLDVPPGEDSEEVVRLFGYIDERVVDFSSLQSTDEETRTIRERIISIRRKMHRNTVSAVTARWNYEEGVSVKVISKELRETV